MAAKTIQPGNILGSARAESDSVMLSKAFVETADFRALIETRDFNFVVGRRGTGKSALYSRVTEHFENHAKSFLLSARPQEHEALALKERLARIGTSYNELRSLSRMAWRIHLLLLVLEQVLTHYKVEKADDFLFLHEIATHHKALLKHSETGRCAQIIDAGLIGANSSAELLSNLASQFQLNRLQKAIQNSLESLHRVALVYYDGLDEGWSPDAAGTAVLGGLAATMADFADSGTGIHGTLFIRDNMFRALAHLDGGFSRHIEGSTLRLHWDENSLLQLVGRRLQVVLNLQSTENVNRIWNKFVDHTLQGKDGFVHCLRHTLYRPRDILILLNRAYLVATRDQRAFITEQDIDSTATSISHDRLQDLVKEYETVLPGLRYFVEVFQAGPALDTLSRRVDTLTRAIDEGPYDFEGKSDFAIFGSGKQILHALFGIGFLGFEDRTREGVFVFNHDGSSGSVETLTESTSCMVHPSYWRALELEPNAPAELVSIHVNDEQQPQTKGDVKDLRTQRLGQILSELPALGYGNEDSGKFEEWVFQAIKILFAGKLANPELKPNRDAIQRRDIVATNMAEDGFWRRIHEDYGSRQVIFEVKNYDALKAEDFRQVLSYASGEYGKFAIIVHRAENEALSEVEKGWVRELYHTHQTLVLTLPASVLARCISKLRNADRFDYTETTLSKRADTFVRSYLSLRHADSFTAPSRRRRR